MLTPLAGPLKLFNEYVNTGLATDADAIVAVKGVIGIVSEVD
jgi:hypothetical protein